MDTAVAPITLKFIMEYFGGYKKLADFSAEWKSLDKESQIQIKAGIANGTYNY